MRYSNESYSIAGGGTVISPKDVAKVRGRFRYLVLYVLKDGPLHGYGIMKKLGELIGMGYVPSSGILYPTLRMLEKEGLVRSYVEGRRKLYELTEKGVKVLEERIGDIEKMISRLKKAKDVATELKLDELLSIVKELWERDIVLPKEVVEDVKKHIEAIITTLRRVLES